MKKIDYHFTAKTVSCYFDADFYSIDQYAEPEHIIWVTDENVFTHHAEKFEGQHCIVIKAGECFKQQATVDLIINELLKLGADKQTILVGVGGGVVTDITGYAASIYKRGIRLALVPTSILAMVDAAIGGKNGVDAGVYKNMVGTIHQPEFILYDFSFLDTLPVKEWINGFAEIIKHACIKDALMFAMLEKYTLHNFQTDKTLVADMIEKNVLLKMDIVTRDEYENGDRKLLNFGHTTGHAIENLHELPHGHAISIGMVAACNLSEKLSSLHFDEARKVVSLLAAYQLPVDIETDHDKVFEVLKLDKKVKADMIDFILLDKIGNGIIKPISLQYLQEQFKSIL